MTFIFSELWDFRESDLGCTVHVLEGENKGAVDSMEITFTFIAEKDKAQWKSAKLHPGQKQLHCAANITLAFCKHPHRQHANANPAKSPE